MLKEYEIHIEETEEDEDEDIFDELEKRDYERRFINYF